MQITSSFQSLLQRFRSVFTAPSFAVFLTVATGWCLCARRRFITEVIQASGAVYHGHHSRYHRFFSHAAWDINDLWEMLAYQLVQEFVPRGVLLIALDDTLCRKRGLSIFGTGMHHDPLISSRQKALVSWGHSWVVATLLIEGLPWAPSKVWALPILSRLYRNRQGCPKGRQGKKPPLDPNHRTRPELALEMLQELAAAFPDRRIVVVADSAYGGRSVLKQLPEHVDLISRVHSKAALYAPPPPRQPGQKGAPRKKGGRLPGMAEWAGDETPPWETLEFDQYGLHATLSVKSRQALYYKAGGTRLLTIVLTRDAGGGGRPDAMLYCTRLDWTVRQILQTYAARWAIEVLFFNAKQFLGLEDPANRLEKAVERTAPFGLVMYSVTVLWFHQAGHRHLRYPERPWYRGKQEPSFADILRTLRRVSGEEFLEGARGDREREKAVLAQLLDVLDAAA
jgi:DDE superfamily endonuclease